MSNQAPACAGGISQGRKSLAALGSGVCAKTEWQSGFSMWKRPLGPLGFSDWSVTLAISGKSFLADHRIDSALLVQEICSDRNALLLLTSVQPRQSSNMVSLKNLRQKSIARAVSSESITMVLPSASTSRPPEDHTRGSRQPRL